MLRAVLLSAAVGASWIAACGGDPYGEGAANCSDGALCNSPDAGAAADVVAPPDCDLTKPPKDSPACIADAVAVFVSPVGSDTSNGTKATPLKTVGKAVQVAAANRLPRVYVCEGSYLDPAEIKQPVSVYGGLTCAWLPSANRPKLAPPSGVGLRITGVAGAVVIEDVDILGTAGGAPGDSAIAVLVSQSSNVVFRNVSLTAGAGVAGAMGLARQNHSLNTASVGNPATGPLGGARRECACPDGTKSTGGRGADGNGVSVESGFASPAVGTMNAGSSSSTTCADGSAGASGLGGQLGIAVTVPGILTSSGWNNTPGKMIVAPNGRPGQGGGGGGSKTTPGAAGGGGGCGGCGGAGGGYGGNGGASFALLSFESGITIENSSLSSGAGGAGGGGGKAQSGQVGGASGVGTGCNGGAGGNGGGGSAGNGGAGGHSAPVAFLGTAPKISASRAIAGTPGAGGAAGTVDGSNAGAPGITGATGQAIEMLSLSPSP